MRLNNIITGSATEEKERKAKRKKRERKRETTDTHEKGFDRKKAHFFGELITNNDN